MKTRTGARKAYICSVPSKCRWFDNGNVIGPTKYPRGYNQFELVFTRVCKYGPKGNLCRCKEAVEAAKKGGGDERATV
jgi:hypothetical protein